MSEDDFDASDGAPSTGRRRFEPSQSFEPFSTDDPDAAAIFDDPLPAGVYSGGSRQPRRRPTAAAARRPQCHERLEDAIRRRLGAVGYDVKFRQDALLVDGKTVGSNLRRRLLRHRDDQDALHDDDAFADIVHSYLPDVLKSQAKAQIKKHNRHAYLKHRGDGPGFLIMQADRQIATVTASSFLTVGGEYQQGPFCAPGEHWDVARTLLLPRSKRPSPEPASLRLLRPSTATISAAPAATAREAASRAIEVDRDRFIDWPEGAPPGLKNLACAASPLLRDHRIRTDEDPVELLTGDGTVIAFESRSGGTSAAAG